MYRRDETREMEGSDRADVARLIHRRAALLARLDDGPAEKPALAASLDSSRSTVDRAIRELESREYLRRGPAGYETTLAGHLAQREYEDGLAALADALSAADLLAHLPSDAPLSMALLRDAEIHRPTPPAPRAPLDRIRELIEHAELYRGFTTAVLVPGFVEEVQSLVHCGDLDIEFVYDEPMANYVRENYTDSLRESLDAERHRMFVVDELPYGFGLLYGERTWTYVIAEGPDGGFRGLLVNDTDAAVAWAESLFERYRARAEQVTSV